MKTNSQKIIFILSFTVLLLLFVLIGLNINNFFKQAQSVSIKPAEVCHECERAESIIPQIINAQTPQANLSSSITQQPENTRIPVYLFWGEGCPHCAQAKPYFEELASKYPRIDLQVFEVFNNADNYEHFYDLAERYGFKATGVPTFFIGSHYWVGFSDEMKVEIESVINQCLKIDCSILETESQTASPEIRPVIISTPQAEIGSYSAPIPSATVSPSPATHNLKVPFLGTIDLNRQSLLISTLLISFVDGFNPCSIWVLTMLLAITLHTGSRKKVFLIGFIFITVTAGIYALFIAGLFSALSIINFIPWVRVLLALIAVFFALVNIKDYFWYKEGISLTIADDKKPGMFQRMRKLLDASQSIWGLAGATAVFAAGVSLVEFSCTAGLPVLWTNILVSQNVVPVSFVLLLLLYLVIYQLDEMGIFFVAVISLKASKLEEKHGRILKLISGMLMLVLAAVMLLNPALMNDLGSSLIIFGGSALLTLVVLLIHNVLLPKLGIHIGNEVKK